VGGAFTITVEVRGLPTVNDVTAFVAPNAGGGIGSSLTHVSGDVWSGPTDVSGEAEGPATITVTARAFSVVQDTDAVNVTIDNP